MCPLAQTMLFSALPIYLAHVSQLQILSSNFLRGLRQLPHNTAMCECLGCSGCKQSRKSQTGMCNWPIGKYQHEKCTKRCHWCFAPLPSTVPFGEADDADTITHVTTWAPEVTSARTSHTWSPPLKVRLLTDSIGMVKSRGK